MSKKFYETTITTKKLDKMVCDICGKVSVKNHWGEGQFDVDRTELTIEQGKVFPEGGVYEKLDIDICPDCFVNKLIPWLESQGVNCEWEEVDV